MKNNWSSKEKNLKMATTSNSSTLSGLYEYYLSLGGCDFKYKFIWFVAFISNFAIIIDPRVENWMMMKSPMKTFGFMVLYLLTIRFIREHMANKKPFELKAFLVVYNFVQVCGSFYIFIEVCILFSSLQKI